MSWFDEQIKQRKVNDDELLMSTYSTLASVVMGRGVMAALESDSAIAAGAIERILNYFHIKQSEPLESVENINEQLEYVMRPHGIMRRPVRLTKGWHKDAVGAMLGTRSDDKTVVALIPGRSGRYSFYDKNLGKKVHVTSSNEKLIDEEALVFYKPFPLREINIKDLMTYILSLVSARDILGVVFMSLVVTLVGMIMPEITQLLFGTVASSKDVGLLVAVGIFMFCVIVSKTLFASIQSVMNSRFTAKMDVAVEAATMMRVLSLPASFFKNYSAGELSAHTQYIGTLCQIIVSGTLTAGLSSVFSLIYIGQIFSYAPALVVPAILVTVVTCIFSVALSIVQRNISKDTMVLQAKESGTSFALISGIQKIKLSGAEKRAFSKWGMLYGKEADAIYNPPLVIKVSTAINVAISTIGTIVMYYYAAVSGVSIANYTAFLASYAMVSTAFLSLTGLATTFGRVRPILEMAKPLMDAKPEISEGKQMVKKLNGTIELNNVSFKYNEGQPNVIDNLTLKIKAGQYVAIVGKTGCGKSTLMRLLLGFEEPQKGAIYYDGHDINTLDLKSLRRRIGVVMQSGKLFYDSIFANITISAPWLSLDDAWDAARKAGIAEDIEQMPMGMNTMISEGSGGVSGGQKQRIMIARAIAPRPKILMLDEATSALDNITQKNVSSALDALKCTRIVIAHRLSTIKQCDRIIVLDGGKIIEDGTYDQLMDKNGFFADLVNRQMA